jgi:hypothetical protein
MLPVIRDASNGTERRENRTYARFLPAAADRYVQIPAARHRSDSFVLGDRPSDHVRRGKVHAVHEPMYSHKMKFPRDLASLFAVVSFLFSSLFAAPASSSPIGM